MRAPSSESKVGAVRISKTSDAVQDRVGVHQLQNPFQHWFRGLLAEVIALVLFVLGLFALAFLVSWVL